MFDYDWETNWLDFKPGNWWQVQEVPTFDNISTKAYEFEKAVDYWVFWG